MAKKEKVALDGLDKFNRIKKPTNILFNIIFIILSLTCIIPVLLVLSISLSEESTITEFGYTLLPMRSSVEGYTFLFNQATMILRALGISVLVTVVGTVLGTVMTMLLGYVMSRPTYKLKTFYSWVVFIPMVFNGGLVATYFITGNLLGLKNTIWALIFPLLISSFNVIICRTFFKQTIPDSLIESAKIDGARQFTIFFKIVLPISLPVLATIGLFLAFAYWNDWYQSMLYISDQKLYSLQALLNSIMSNITALAQQIATITDFVHDAIIAIDENEKITVYNRRAEQVFGVPQERARGRLISDVVPNTKLPEILATGIPQLGELQNLWDSRIVTNRVPITVDGEVKGAVATFQDVTEVQNLEEKIRRSMSEKGFIAKYTFDDIVYASRQIAECIKTAKKFAMYDTPIHICGASGVGKELFCQSIHNYSHRHLGPFVAVNCAAIAPSLIESGFFGYEEGSFTGARK